MPFILAAGLLYFAFYKDNLSVAFKIIKNSSYSLIALTVLTTFISHYIRAFRWKIMLRSVKSDAKINNLFSALMIGYGINCLLPRFGEVARAVVVAKTENLSKSSMFGTVIVERIIDMIFFILAIIITGLYLGGRVYKQYPGLELSLVIAGIVTFAMLVIFYLMTIYKEKVLKFVDKLTNKFQNKIVKKLPSIINTLIIGFSTLKSPKDYLITILLSFLIIINYALNSYLGFKALALVNTSFMDGWSVMSIGAIGAVIPTPGAIGSYHAIANSFLTNLLSISKENSAAYTIVMHGVNYVQQAILGVVFMIIMNQKYKFFESRAIFKVNSNEA